jgi:Meckel syndrome type 1 protein
VEIIIRTDAAEAAVTPATVEPTTMSAAAAPADLAARAAGIGAINAGPAPTPPGLPGSPQAHVVAERQAAAQAAADQSAGPAPT